MEPKHKVATAKERALKARQYQNTHYTETESFFTKNVKELKKAYLKLEKKYRYAVIIAIFFFGGNFMAICQLFYIELEKVLDKDWHGLKSDAVGITIFLVISALGIAFFKSIAKKMFPNAPNIILYGIDGIGSMGDVFKDLVIPRIKKMFSR